MLTGNVPETLRLLLAAFAPCFTVRTFATFQALVAGFLAQPGVRTVTGMLTAAGLAGRRHHDVAYRFFATARWSADEVGLVVAGLAVTLLPAGAPLLVVVDDTLLRRAGRRLHGAAWHHDGTTTARGRAATAQRGATAGSSSGSWSGCRSWRTGRCACRSCAGCGNPGTPTTPRQRSPASCSRRSPGGSPTARCTWSAMPRTPPAPGVACPAGSRSPPGCAATRRCTSCHRRAPGELGDPRPRATGCPNWS